MLLYVDCFKHKIVKSLKRSTPIHTNTCIETHTHKGMLMHLELQDVQNRNPLWKKNIENFWQNSIRDYEAAQAFWDGFLMIYGVHRLYKGEFLQIKVFFWVTFVEFLFCRFKVGVTSNYLWYRHPEIRSWIFQCVVSRWHLAVSLIFCFTRQFDTKMAISTQWGATAARTARLPQSFQFPASLNRAIQRCLLMRRRLV